jgi:threonine dehydrogenase-like Zn-dependent dehydrogenase
MRRIWALIWWISSSSPSGKISTAPLISHRFRLEDGARCFEIMYRRTETFTKMMFLPEKT